MDNINMIAAITVGSVISVGYGIYLWYSSKVPVNLPVIPLNIDTSLLSNQSLPYIELFIPFNDEIGNYDFLPDKAINQLDTKVDMPNILNNIQLPELDVATGLIESAGFLEKLVFFLKSFEDISSITIKIFSLIGVFYTFYEISNISNDTLKNMVLPTSLKNFYVNPKSNGRSLIQRFFDLQNKPHHNDFDQVNDNLIKCLTLEFKSIDQSTVKLILEKFFEYNKISYSDQRDILLRLLNIKEYKVAGFHITDYNENPFTVELQGYLDELKVFMAQLNGKWKYTLVGPFRGNCSVTGYDENTFSTPSLTRDLHKVSRNRLKDYKYF